MPSTEQPTIECRIHGGYWHFPLIGTTKDGYAIVKVPPMHSHSGREAVLRIVPADQLRFHENAAVIR
jgi:hypothetical protein